MEQRFSNVTLYLRSEFMGNIIRRDARELVITTGVKYAQYENATKVEWVGARQRKWRGFYLTYKPFLVVLNRAEAFDPPRMMGVILPGSATDMVVTASTYCSHHPGWQRDFLAQVRERKVTPVYEEISEERGY